MDKYRRQYHSGGGVHCAGVKEAVCPGRDGGAWPVTPVTRGVAVPPLAFTGRLLRSALSLLTSQPRPADPTFPKHPALNRRRARA